MRIVHLADLHLGKRLGEVPLAEDQEHILRQILGVMRDEEAECLIISGDIYDRGVPPQEAVTMFGSFLAEARSVAGSIFIISGNHDSPERLGFGSEIFAMSQIHVAGVFSGSLEKVTLGDGSGPLNIWLLPYVKPVQVRQFYPDIKEGSFEDAVKTVIKAADINREERNILVAHQFVTSESWPQVCESETSYVGTVGNMDYRIFDDFDYVALGHLHTPQYMGREQVRYPGSPLKYSFSETRSGKSVTVLDIKAKGDIDIKTVPLTPLRDMREVRGYLKDVLGMEQSEDYMRVTLLDEDATDAADRIRTVFPNVLRIDFDNSYTRGSLDDTDAGIEGKGDMELFSEFYEKMRDAALTDEQAEIAGKAMIRAKEDTDETSLS
ncbi:MAG: exonuclease SbcCD subunit D [Christensenellaceae bacterium]|nr:exonuclease SbcCD subunit D [Christensenellaceae bacterium]